MLHSRPLFLFPSVPIYHRQSLQFGHGPLQVYTDCIRIVRHEDAVGYPRIHFTRILYVLVPTYLPTYNTNVAFLVHDIHNIYYYYNNTIEVNNIRKGSKVKANIILVLF